ncbi:MAG: hypothetical protein C3F15_09880 [Holophagae bacterium]|nr:MAG: hypothetical protein C3F15_09880 [Holophagae bacterium]
MAVDRGTQTARRGPGLRRPDHASAIDVDESAGRNFDEILRAIDSLQFTSDYEVVTPVNWARGRDVMILPTVSIELAMRRFPRGWREQNAYIRLVSDPRR